MARLFDGTTDGIDITDGADLTFGNAWTFSVWVKLTDNIGSTQNWVASWGDTAGTKNFNVFIFEASHATIPNEIRMDMQDSSGDRFLVTSSSAPFLNNTSWTNIIVTRTGTTGEGYVDNVSWGTDSDAQMGDIDRTENLDIGRRYNGTAFFKGRIAEVAKWDVALNANERQAIVNGVNPFLIQNASLAYYFPLHGINSPETDYTGRGNVANLNVGAATRANGPPVLSLSSRWARMGGNPLQLDAAAAGITPDLYASALQQHPDNRVYNPPVSVIPY